MFSFPFFLQKQNENSVSILSEEKNEFFSLETKILCFHLTMILIFKIEYTCKIISPGLKYNAEETSLYFFNKGKAKILNNV